MKDVFFGILSFLLIGAIWFAVKNDCVYELPSNTTGLVIDKESSQMLGDHITILKPDSTTELFICYDILFDNIETGDSVVNGEIVCR